MTGMRSWMTLAAIYLLLFGACSAMAGGTYHWPGSLPAGAMIVAGKLLNDRFRFAKWPMEFVFWSAMLFILSNLIYLHYRPM